MVSRAVKYLLPVGATVVCLPNISVVFAADKKKSSPSSIYDEPQCKVEPPAISQSPPSGKKDDCSDTELERLVMQARQALGPVRKVTDQYTDEALIQMKKGYQQVMANVCYLRTKAPHEVKIGTIVTSGLIGMAFGFRRGLTKKLLYGGLAAAGASYTVYPEDTIYFSKNGLTIAKKYSTVAYNFVFAGRIKEQEKAAKRPICPYGAAPDDSLISVNPNIPPKPNSKCRTSTADEEMKNELSAPEGCRPNSPASKLRAEKAERNLKSQ